MSLTEMQQESNLRTIGKYRVLGTLGRGSMGVVYRAEDPEIGRVVAIKTLRAILPGQLKEADNAIQRFRQEARSAGNLRHPNIVTVFELGREGDTPYLVMDYIEGQSLDQLITRNPRPIPEMMIHYLAQIAAGLDCAHAKGVVHRDIKPSNILVDKSDSAFILDFGVATFNEGALAQPNMILGTPAYMAPEQIMNQAIDWRVDLFALAVVAFECFTGKRPFVGENYTAVMASILNARPASLTGLAPQLPVALEAEMERALSRNKETRHQSAAEMISAFATALGVPVPGILAATGRRRKNSSREGNAANAAEQGRRGTNGTGTWKRVRQRRFSDMALDKALVRTGVNRESARFNKFGDRPVEQFSPWHNPEKIVDQWGRIRNDDKAPAKPKTRVGESLFGMHYSGTASSVADLLGGRWNMSYLVTCVFGGISLVITVVLVYLVLSPPAVRSAAASQPQQVEQGVDGIAASVVDESDHVAILVAPKVDPVPEGKQVYEMTAKELLGVIVSAGIADDLVLSALREAESRGVQYLLEALTFPLQSDSFHVRVATIQLAGRLGDRRIVPYMLPSLDDHDPVVRGHAAKALGQLGDKAALAYLSSRYTREDELTVKTVIKRAIERINGFPMGK